MNTESLGFIFLNSALVNNFVLALFLGICPFLGISGKRDTAFRMGMAVTFVLVVTATAAYGVHKLLVYFDALYLELIAYIAVIASSVQLVEMFIKRVSPTLFRALGIYLPLITTNCAVLGLALFQTARGYNFLQSLVFAVGSGLGFTVALVIMAGLREELSLANVPNIVQGTALTLILAGILSLAFMGFGGLGS
jgi:electron transport complex protein RnfA